MPPTNPAQSLNWSSYALIESSYYSGGSCSRLITVCGSFKLTPAIFFLNIRFLTENNKLEVPYVFTKRYWSFSTNWLWGRWLPTYCKLSFSFSLSPTNTHIQCKHFPRQSFPLLDRNKWRPQEFPFALAQAVYNRADSSDHS